MKKKSKVQRRFSAGGVVFKKVDHSFEILLLKREDKREKWLLPKGEIEEDNVEDTALREISEETGLKNLRLIDKLGSEKYMYKESWAKGDLIFKIVTYFLVESLGNEKPIPQEEEGFTEAKWFSKDEAIKNVTYKNSQDIIKKAIKLLR